MRRRVHSRVAATMAAMVMAAGCQLIGGIDSRSVGPDADAGASDSYDTPDATDGAPDGGADSMGDTGTPDEGAIEAGGMGEGGADSPTEAACGDDAALTYPEEVRCDSPLAYWRLDESTGSKANDSSGNGNDATYEGGYTLGASGIAGNTAVQLDGTSGYVSAGNRFAFAGAVPFTLEAWILPTTIDTSFRGVMSNEPQSDAGKEGYVMYLQTADSIGYDRYATGVSTTLTAPGAVVATSTKFYHVVGVYDGASMTLYVNSSVVDTHPTVLSIDAGTCIFAVGASHCATPGLANYLQGTIDEVAVYGTALPKDRIIKHYQVGSGQ